MDRKTVYRWISGKTPRISSVHLRNLAELLDCDEARLLLSPAMHERKADDRWAHAWRLADTRINETIVPSNNYEAAALFLESTIDDAMPIELKARLRLQLARVYQRLHRVNDMRDCANFIMEYASSSSDLFMERRARFLLATAELMDGNLALARQWFSEIIESEKHFIPLSELGSNYANLAATLSALGEFDESLKNHRIARQAWAQKPSVASNVISAFHFSQTLSEVGKFEEASAAAAECVDIANLLPFERLRIQADILRADILSGQGRSAEAASLLEQHMDELLALPNFDIICLEFAARTWRLAGDHARAQQTTQEIIDGNEVDLRLARILLERARLELAEGREAEARSFVEKANEVYRACGALRRIGPPLPLEYWDEAQRISALP